MSSPRLRIFGRLFQRIVRRISATNCGSGPPKMLGGIIELNAAQWFTHGQFRHTQCLQVWSSRARWLGALARHATANLLGPRPKHRFKFLQRRMLALQLALIAAPIVIGVYAYALYPIILAIVAAARPARRAAEVGSDWPSVTITVPVYNAVSSIRATLERLLTLDYPREKLQLLVISDASNDGTDDVVGEFRDKGVELLRMDARFGKTTAENAAVSHARGEIIVNVDGTVLVPEGSLKPLVRVFDDPTVGVASSRDVSVGDVDRSVGVESSYVGYEMWIRDLETRTGSIVGASGCFYAIRRAVHARPLPGDLSWDFASALVARTQGYRSVSVPAAVCIVPRTAQLRTEMTRKVRTMARGLKTLFFFRSLMNPFRYGWFSFMLVSHKLLRWLPYLLTPVALFALAGLALQSDTARVGLGAIAIGLVVGCVGIVRPAATIFRPVAVAGFVVAAFSAGLMAWRDALGRTQMATWEPTPRPHAQ
jgi:glycosyltransferase involved in cell wall biosynthesis